LGIGLREENMENPWLKLNPKADKNGEYVLDIDSEAIKKLKEKLAGKFQLQLSLFPEPFVGNPNDAEIYFLNLNPGFSEKDIKDMPAIKKHVFKNNQHESMEYPFYWLDPALKETGGGKWWRRILSPLLKEIDKKISVDTLKLVSKKYVA
jgi:hypothetical protein